MKVAQHLRPNDAESVHLSRSHSRFKEDNEVPERFRAKLKDYHKSGFDRGHLAPAADMNALQSSLDQSFFRNYDVT